jgi:hypothetical protein
MKKRTSALLGLAVAAVAVAAVGLVLIESDHARNSPPKASQPREVLPMQAHNSGLDVRCSADVAESRVTVRYSVTNRSNEDVYLYDNGDHPDADLVCDAGDGAVNVLMGISPLPSNPVTWKHHPKTTRLAPGEHKDGAFTLPLPLREISAYHNETYAIAERVEVKKLRLLIDYVRASSPKFTATPEPRGTPECAVSETPVELTLERRGDEFTRRGTEVL